MLRFSTKMPRRCRHASSSSLLPSSMCCALLCCGLCPWRGPRLHVVVSTRLSACFDGSADRSISRRSDMTAPAAIGRAAAMAESHLQIPTPTSPQSPRPLLLPAPALINLPVDALGGCRCQRHGDSGVFRDPLYVATTTVATATSSCWRSGLKLAQKGHAQALCVAGRRNRLVAFKDMGTRRGVRLVKASSPQSPRQRRPGGYGLRRRQPLDTVAHRVLDGTLDIVVI